MYYGERKFDLPLDPSEVGLYLAITVDRDELVRLGLKDFCHTRLKTGSWRSGLTTKEISDRTDLTPKLMCCIIVFPHFVISLTLATGYIISIFVQFNKTCINNQRITMVAITYSCNSLNHKRFPDKIFLRPQQGEGRASPS